MAGMNWPYYQDIQKQPKTKKNYAKKQENMQKRARILCIEHRKMRKTNQKQQNSKCGTKNKKQTQQLRHVDNK